MARAGDLGYTTGPWEFKADIHDAKSVAWGHFLTVWKRQPDGSWKFAIDLGISNPQPAQAEAPWQLAQGYKTPKAMKGSLLQATPHCSRAIVSFRKPQRSAGRAQLSPTMQCRKFGSIEMGSFP